MQANWQINKRAKGFNHVSTPFLTDHTNVMKSNTSCLSTCRCQNVVIVYRMMLNRSDILYIVTLTITKKYQKLKKKSNVSVCFIEFSAKKNTYCHELAASNQLFQKSHVDQLNNSGSDNYNEWYK